MLFIIVPFADLHPEEGRSVELDHFITHMKIRIPVLFKEQVYIIIVEQLTPEIFNRGQLLNIGAIYAKSLENPRDSIYVTHDVDMLPNDDLLEQYTMKGTKMDTISFIPIDESFKKLYKFDFISIGGAISGSRGEVFFRANGYPNNFWGWGAEDYVYGDRLQKIKATVDRVKKGFVEHIDTLRLQGKKNEHLKNKRLKNMISREMRQKDRNNWKQNGVRNLKNYTIKKTIKCKFGNLCVVRLQCDLDAVGFGEVRESTKKIYESIK